MALFDIKKLVKKDPTVPEDIKALIKRDGYNLLFIAVYTID